MKLRALVAALILTAGPALVAPGTAEARHRHNRHCRHGAGYYDGYYDSGPRYGYRHGRSDYGYYDHPRYYGYGYDGGYGYRYRRVWVPRVYVHYHSGVRCTRSHGGLYLRW